MAAMRSTVDPWAYPTNDGVHKQQVVQDLDNMVTHHGDSSTAALKKWQDALEDKEQTLEARRVELDNDRTAFEAEKASITRQTARPSDIIAINMGGEKVVQVKRSLLTQYEGTFLSGMFSGRWEESIARDTNGNVFFDDPPEIIMPLIQWLRASRDRQPGQLLTLPVVEPQHQKAWHNMVKRFGLESELPPSAPKCIVGSISEMEARSDGWCKVKWDEDASISLHRFCTGIARDLVCYAGCSTVVESPHDYRSNMDTWQQLRVPFACKIKVYFDKRSSTLSNIDYVRFCKVQGDKSQYWGLEKYSGEAIFGNFPYRSSPLIIPSDRCWVYFHSDFHPDFENSATSGYWGYKVHADIGEIDTANAPDDVIARMGSVDVGTRVISVSL